MMTRALRDYSPERLAERESQDRQRRRWHKLIEGEAQVVPSFASW